MLKFVPPADAAALKDVCNILSRIRTQVTLGTQVGYPLTNALKESSKITISIFMKHFQKYRAYHKSPAGAPFSGSGGKVVPQSVTELYK